MKNLPVFLGIDLGTSSVKCLAINEAGQSLSLSAREYPIQSPYPGWAEQDPQVWLQATIESIQECVRKADVKPDQVAGIGFSGQMHGLIPVSAAGKALRPAIIWADQRAQEQVRLINERIGKERLGRWTGNPLATGFMLASWLWLRANEPDITKQTRWLLLPKDYLRLQFTGEIGSEPSDASGTLLFNTASRVWSSSLLEALDIDHQLLPPLGESEQIAGTLLPEIAHQCGLPPGIPVVYGGSDQALQALGHGVTQPGIVSCTIGTGGQLFAPTDKPAYDPELRLHLFCHAIPERWHLEAAILSAGLSLKWVRDRIFKGHTYQWLADLAGEAPPGCEGLLFLPYLAGERTPWMDPKARGSWVGLTLHHEQSHMVRSVMEGVVFALRQGLELMETLGVPVEKIIASGGAVNHPLWLQLQADIFKRPVYQTETVEAAAFGASLLATTGAGYYPDVETAIRNTVRLNDHVIIPDLARVEIYEQAYQRFIRMYPRIREP